MTRGFTGTLKREWLISWELDEASNKPGLGKEDASGKRGKGISCERNSMCKVPGNVGEEVNWGSGEYTVDERRVSQG